MTTTSNNKGKFLSSFIVFIIVVVIIVIVAVVLTQKSETEPTPPATQQTPTQQSTQQTPTQQTPTSQPAPWRCLTGITVPLRLNAEGDVECMSTNEKDCLWRNNSDECNGLLGSLPGGLKPLVCGDGHARAWGSTGYDNPDHWCSKGKPMLTQPIQQP